MVFSSAIFLFCFLPAVFLLAQLPFSRRYQNFLLAAASLVFYAFGNLHYVPLFLCSILLNYLSGLLLGTRLKHSRILITLNILLNLGILLSANLGVMNLIPFPALDGGRILLLLIEAVRRRKLSGNVEAYINLAGFAVLMCLMVVILFNDIRKLF